MYVANVGFDGKLKKEAAAVSYLNGLQVEAVSPTAGADYVDLQSISGPVYAGDGYLAVAAIYPKMLNFHQPPSIRMPFINNSFRMDDDGYLISGPYNVGGQYPYWFTRGILSGNHVSFMMETSWYSFPPGSYICSLGRKGGHMGNVDLTGTNYEHFATTSQTYLAYTGFATTVVYNGYAVSLFFCPPKITDYNDAIYCNQISMPNRAKPGFFYFQAGTAEPMKDHRLVMWSIVKGSGVTLKGPDFEMTNLPPVWSYLVDTRGERTVLKLSFTTEDGKTNKKRLVIEP